MKNHHFVDDVLEFQHFFVEINVVKVPNNFKAQVLDLNDDNFDPNEHLVVCTTKMLINGVSDELIV